MVRRNPARYLAPLALAATITGTYLIVHSGLRPKRTPTPHAAIQRSRPHGRYAKAKFYTVKSGDSLSSISVKTGITVPKLEALNPKVDPGALQTGQLLRLRR